jgi:hypothetical protein
MIVNNWFYKSKEIKEVSDFPEGCFGFCYMIKNLKTGEFYIGRKVLENNIKRKIGKKEKLLFEGKGRKPSFEKIKKESNWKEYWGSCKPLLEEVAKIGEDQFERQILELAFNKRQLSYLEVKYQMVYEVLENKLSYNDNISGKFFKKDLAH